MKTYQFNKLIIAVLLALGTAGVIRLAVDRFYPRRPVGELTYEIDIAEPASGAAAAPAAKSAPADEAAPVDESSAGATQQALLANLIAQSDPAAGEKLAGVCKACHSFAKGGPNMMGPNLWNVVDREKASAPGFSYSPALESLSGAWTYEDLDAFFTGPSQFAPGTKMAYAGLADAQDRAALIAYLRTQADAPASLPAQ
ncbi:MAG: c-type cytochrome [Parvularculaceae bacterium]